MNRLIVIGAGNVGGTLIRKLVNKSFPVEIIAVEKDLKKRNRLPVPSFSQLSHVDFSEAHTILSIHSHELKDLKSNLLTSNQPNKVISTMAGVSIFTLKMIFPSAQLARVMPNIAMEQEASNSVIFSECSKLSKDTEEIFRYTGNPYCVKNEHFMDIATGLMGTGPAIFLKMAELMAKEAVNQGIPKEIAVDFAKSGLLAANAIQDNEDNISDIINKITSPGGTTQAALDVLERFHFEETLASVIRKTTTRSIEIDIATEKQIKKS